MAEVEKSFKNLNLTKQIYSAIDDLGFNTPTPIQEKLIPMAIGGHDLFGIAPTGTGKTAAYLIPILLKLKYAQGIHPRALILSPTRELSIQINQDLADLSKYYDLRHQCLIGGIGIKPQIESLQKGVDIISATPGRFLDIYYGGNLFVRSIKTLILDEADKMMDMGFHPQINKILEIIPAKKRQNMLFSATLPPEVEKLSEEFLEFPSKIEIAPQSTTATSIKQSFYKTPNLKTKINLLSHFLSDSDQFLKVIIFCKTKDSANNIYKFIQRKIDDNVKVIHANKSQNTRLNAINEFKSGNIRILVSTDVSSRGIDVSKVSHVINFDVPIIYEDYIHRIGRTGRAEQTGSSITFVTEPDLYHLRKIEKIIRKKIEEIPIPRDVVIENTEQWEKQMIARELDNIKRKLNPDFKGAFHKKKKKNSDKRKPK